MTKPSPLAAASFAATLFIIFTTVPAWADITHFRDWAARSEAYNDAKDAMSRGNYTQARYILETASNAGDPLSQFYFANLYARGLAGLPLDQCIAAGWFAKAASSGHPGALHALTYYYSNGIGVERDFIKSVAMARLSQEAFAKWRAIARVGMQDNASTATMLINLNAKKIDDFLSWVNTYINDDQTKDVESAVNSIQKTGKVEVAAVHACIRNADFKLDQILPPVLASLPVWDEKISATQALTPRLEKSPE